MKAIICAALLLCMIHTMTIAQGSMHLLSLKRKFKGNGEWVLKTTRGEGMIKNIFSSGNLWELTIPTLRQVCDPGRL